MALHPIDSSGTSTVSPGGASRAHVATYFPDPSHRTSPIVGLPPSPNVTELGFECTVWLSGHYTIFWVLEGGWVSFLCLSRGHGPDQSLLLSILSCS